MRTALFVAVITGLIVVSMASANGLALSASGPKCFGQHATITGAGTILGTEGDDVIVGSEGNDTLVGFGGDDLLCGLGGIDRLRAGLGDDRLDGGEGNDVLNGDSSPISSQGPTRTGETMC